MVANLSRYAQWTELPLAGYQGRVPVELFGARGVPRIGADPYLISLGPHSFLWFRLASDPAASELGAGQGDLPELPWRGDLRDLLQRSGDDGAGILLRWMRRQSWYRGGAREVRSARVVATLVIPSQPRAMLASLEVQYRHDDTVTYLLPLTWQREPDPEAIAAVGPQAIIARLVGSAEVALLLDGSQVPGVLKTLLQIVLGRRHARVGEGELVGHRQPGLGAAIGPVSRDLEAWPIRELLSMSNSSAIFWGRLVLKLYRVLEVGRTPTWSWESSSAAEGSPAYPASWARWR